MYSVRRWFQLYVYRHARNKLKLGKSTALVHVCTYAGTVRYEHNYSLFEAYIYNVQRNRNPGGHCRLTRARKCLMTSSGTCGSLLCSSRSWIPYDSASTIAIPIQPAQHNCSLARKKYVIFHYEYAYTHARMCTVSWLYILYYGKKYIYTSYIVTLYNHHITYMVHVLYSSYKVVMTDS